MTLNDHPDCNIPQACARLGDRGLCRACARAKLLKRTVFVVSPAKKKPIIIPPWCPPSLAGMYETVLGIMHDRIETRRIVEDHMRIRGIPAPGAAP